MDFLERPTNEAPTWGYSISQNEKEKVEKRQNSQLEMEIENDIWESPIFQFRFAPGTISFSILSAIFAVRNIIKCFYVKLPKHLKVQFILVFF